MRQNNLNKVVFFSKEDMAGGHFLQKGESVLRNDIKSDCNDINDILELYNIKKYIDNELYLKDWSPEDIILFKHRVAEYGKIIGNFMATINDDNIHHFYLSIIREYIHSFWEIVNNQKIFRRISKSNFNSILSNEPHTIHELLTHKSLVEYFNTEIKTFLLTYSKSAEILLSLYEVKDDFSKNKINLPESLTVADKELILSNYLDSKEVNYNYIGLIENARNRNDFKVSDRTRLKAKRLQKSETEKIFTKDTGLTYSVSVRFPENVTKIKDGTIDKNHGISYTYSLDFIKQNSDPYSLFINFNYLFEYLDPQHRINLVSKKNKLSVLERFMGVHSQNEYRGGIEFNLTEMTSHIQMVAYNLLLTDLGVSLENVLHHVFTSSFKEKYNFAENAHFTIPSASSFFEKVRLLAPEYESVLKQYKLFVEEGHIDFGLLQISSAPISIKDIPSLNRNKYCYFNENNKEFKNCSNLFFSDQTLLAHVEPFKDKRYNTFLELLIKEEVKYDGYEDFQKPQIDYLIERGLIMIDDNNLIKLKNHARLFILKDLYFNEFASFHRYPSELQHEAQQMEIENIVFFNSSLFSIPEQSYFNYYLNKSEFTNGLDLRNSYLHGTQATPDEKQKHEHSYFTYLKLIVLSLLKMEDDLAIYKYTI